MRENPGPLETDRLGSLSSLPGVHVVDSSVFPDISSFPTAFTAMANAHRIASEIVIPHGN
jgi:choline dehydrogenase-like flavoprotein